MHQTQSFFYEISPSNTIICCQNSPPDLILQTCNLAPPYNYGGAYIFSIFTFWNSPLK